MWPSGAVPKKEKNIQIIIAYAGNIYSLAMQDGFPLETVSFDSPGPEEGIIFNRKWCSWELGTIA